MPAFRRLTNLRQEVDELQEQLDESTAGVKSESEAEQRRRTLRECIGRNNPFYSVSNFLVGLIPVIVALAIGILLLVRWLAI